MSRIRKALSEHGVAGVGRKVVERARSHVYRHEEHIWYELRLEGAVPVVGSLGVLELRRARLSDAALLGAFGRNPDLTADDVRKGHDLWFVMEGETPAFSCFIQRGESPMPAARRGRMKLPSATVCLEDSVTSPDYRGRGLAPAAWTTLAAQLEQEPGLGSMITKVAVENVASRKAVTKAGFVEVALMRHDKRGPRARVEVEVYDGAAMGQTLQRHLQR